VNLDRFMQQMKASRFLRFGIVGAGGFVVDTLVLFVMHRVLGLDPYSARAISIFAAMNFTWIGNRLITFRAHAAVAPGEIAGEWARFLLTNAFGALVNYAVYAAIVRFAPPPANSPYLGLVAGVAAGLTFNFTLSKRLVFRGPPVA
jgi:putative flippase GtrA